MMRCAVLIAALSSLALPAAAGAATLTTGADGLLVYQAAVGERNDVTARDDFGGPGPRLVFTETGARVRASVTRVDRPADLALLRADVDLP
jgi:hypothetical protein